MVDNDRKVFIIAESELLGKLDHDSTYNDDGSVLSLIMVMSHAAPASS